MKTVVAMHPLVGAIGQQREHNHSDDDPRMLPHKESPSQGIDRIPKLAEQSVDGQLVVTVGLIRLISNSRIR